LRLIDKCKWPRLRGHLFVGGNGSLWNGPPDGLRPVCVAIGRNAFNDFCGRRTGLNGGGQGRVVTKYDALEV